VTEIGSVLKLLIGLIGAVFRAAPVIVSRVLNTSRQIVGILWIVTKSHMAVINVGLILVVTFLAAGATRAT
jgi:hypothetical protein